MALISPTLYIGEVGNVVKLIRNPGQYDEKVLFDFIFPPHQRFGQSIRLLESSPDITDQEKMRASFWLGYFYAHSVRPQQYNDPEADKGVINV